MPPPTVGMTALSYYLPPDVVSIEQLAAAGKLTSDVSTLRELGWKQARIARNESAPDLADHALQNLFDQGIDPASIDVLVYCGATVASFYADGRPPDVGDLWEHFRYPPARALDRWGMVNASLVPVVQQGCNTLFTGIRVARALILAEPDVSRVLCVSSDVLPPDGTREALFSVLSDASCCVLVERDGPENQILCMEQATKGYYWDPFALQTELTAGYFATARNVMVRALKKAVVRVEDLRWIVPHNVSPVSWEILLSILGWPRDLIFSEGMSAGGHTISADNIINLKDLQDRSAVAPGDLMLLFTFGFGATWSAMVVQH